MLQFTMGKQQTNHLLFIFRIFRERETAYIMAQQGHYVCGARAPTLVNRVKRVAQVFSCKLQKISISNEPHNSI